jgi:hypothetical protein
MRSAPGGNRRAVRVRELVAIVAAELAIAAGQFFREEISCD